MPRPPSLRHRPVRAFALPVAVVVAALGLGSLGPSAVAESAAGPAPIGAPASTPSTTPGGTDCAPLLRAPTRVRDLVGSTAPKAKSVLSSARTADALESLTPTELADPTLFLDTCGTPLFVESGRASGDSPDTARTEAEALSAPSSATAPRVNPLGLSSRPGANRTIYLDFTGQPVSATLWNRDWNNRKPFTAPAWSLDGDVSANFSAAEVAGIQRIWRVVADDYAPFNINVTTKAPRLSALLRKNRADRDYGTQVVISNRQPFSRDCSCGGIAYMNALKYLGRNSSALRYAFVFYGNSEGLKPIGDLVSHEAGHTFGLVHDGQRGSRDPYYAGRRPWSPIMGRGPAQPLSQWSNGSYPRANNKQNDLAVIGRYALRVRDAAPNRASGKSPVLLPRGAKRRSVAGLITSASDVDIFAIRVNRNKRIVLNVRTRTALSNLDSRVSLLNARGKLLRTRTTPTRSTGPGNISGLGSSLTYQAKRPGLYYVAVRGTGQGRPKDGGYTSYGSLGRYVVTATAR